MAKKEINPELEKQYEESEAKHQEKIELKKAKAEEKGGFALVWFKFTQLGLFQWWRKKWSHFAIYHPSLAKWIYQIFYFFVFSNGVTIWQYLVMLFLPHLFGIGLASQEFVWPSVTLWTWSDGTPAIFGIFNEPVLYENGQAIIGGGLGNFIAFEIAVFTAQCINFPLQRNITFKSKGNPVYQAMWYFIGWVAISILVNACWGFVNMFMIHWSVAPALSNLLKTFITGGLSMVVFFFIFKIIFPEGESKKEPAAE
jgi:putative flippase GtrA